LQKSYIVKSPINFANFGFFVRVGDILVHDPVNGNKLIVYRGGEIVKAMVQTTLGMAALLKQGFISELVVTQPTPPPPKKVVEEKKEIVKPDETVVLPRPRKKHKIEDEKPKDIDSSTEYLPRNDNA
jgi:hypothetical protein